MASFYAGYPGISIFQETERRRESGFSWEPFCFIGIRILCKYIMEMLQNMYISIIYGDCNIKCTI